MIREDCEELMKGGAVGAGMDPWRRVGPALHGDNVGSYDDRSPTKPPF